MNKLIPDWVQAGVQNMLKHHAQIEVRLGIEQRRNDTKPKEYWYILTPEQAQETVANRTELVKVYHREEM